MYNPIIQMFKNLFKLGCLSLVLLGLPMSIDANDFTFAEGPRMDLDEGSHAMTVSFPKEGEGYLFLSDRNSSIINIYDANLKQMTAFADNESIHYIDRVIFEISSTKWQVMGDYSIGVSQCLFNDDSEFEILAWGGSKQVKQYTDYVYNEETQSVEEVTIDYEAWVENSLKLMQSNNICLAEIPNVDNLEVRDVRIVMLNDNLYIVLLNEAKTYWYLWNKQQASLNKVAELPAFQAFPNPVKHGEKFNITLTEGINGESTIAVYNMNGGLVSVMQGEGSTIYVDTNSLSAGHYVYAVTNNGLQIANGHLIIK